MKIIYKAILGIFAVIIIVLLAQHAYVHMPQSEPTTIIPTATPSMQSHKFQEGDILVAPWSSNFARKDMYPHDIMLEGQILLVKKDTYTLAYPEYIKNGRLVEIDIESIDESCMRFDGTREDLQRLIREYNEDYCAIYEPSYRMSEAEITQLIDIYAIRSDLF